MISSAIDKHDVAAGLGALITLTIFLSFSIKKSSIKLPSSSQAWALTPEPALSRSLPLISGINSFSDFHCIVCRSKFMCRKFLYF